QATRCLCPSTADKKEMTSVAEPGGAMERATSRGASTADGPLVTRRSFFGVLLAAGTTAVGALLSVPLVRLVLHPLFRATTPATWCDIGPLDELLSIN